jgi:hypothetical protein
LDVPAPASANFCISLVNVAAVKERVLCSESFLLYIPLFSSLQVRHFDPFCLEMIPFEHGTTTALLQRIEIAHAEAGGGLGKGSAAVGDSKKTGGARSLEGGYRADAG